MGRGSPVTGSYDFEFNLYDHSDPGTAILLGSDSIVGAPLASGRFTVELDFGPAFAGDAAWLQIGLRPNGSADPYTYLSPLQPITATPVAQYALDSPTGWTCPNQSQDDYGVCHVTHMSDHKTYEQAAVACKDQGMRLCTVVEIEALYAAGAQWCAYLWTVDWAPQGTSYRVLPNRDISSGCGAPGTINKILTPWTETWGYVCCRQ